MQRLKKLLETEIIHSERLRRAVPGPVKRALKRRVPYADYRSEQLRREAERLLGGPIPTESDYDSPHGVTLGIFFDNGYAFASNVAACRELRVKFKVIDIMASDWIQLVRDSGCDTFLATPATLRSLWHRMYEERLWVVVNHLQKCICPSFEELFLWESKRRMHDWLVANDVPHPDTWVFFDRNEALRFCRETRYPVVAKTNSGAAASGIFVLDCRKEAEKLVKKAFAGGILGRSSDPREREDGTIIFQEHVPHDYEWRVVRIGDYFLCRRKVRIGAHASGSGDIGWAEPLPGMLDFARDVTEQGGFTSMAVDLFVTPEFGNGLFLVNELQTIFGAIKQEANLNEHAGRWTILESGRWVFEPGFFYQNACANLRVQMLLDGGVAQH